MTTHEANKPDDAATPLPHPLQLTNSIGDALARWRHEGGDPAFGLPVADVTGDAVVNIFFAEPELVRQLSGAKEVQERLLPGAVPRVSGFDFAGRHLAAGHVGGDYWSVKYYREENIVTCKLADVTGHGIAAAILVAAVKFVSGVLFRYSPSPAAVMERTNHSLLRETSPDRMATMVYAWVYPETRKARIVNAGHAPAFLCQGTDGKITDLPATGPLLGLMETSYGEIMIDMADGDLIFVCSDGVAEAGDPPKFDDRHIKDLVRTHRAATADAIADAVFQSAITFTGKVRDDMSLLVIKAVPDQSLSVISGPSQHA